MLTLKEQEAIYRLNLPLGTEVSYVRDESGRLTFHHEGKKILEVPPAIKLTTTEKCVIVAALLLDIATELKSAEANPTLKGYVERNIQFREEIITKVEGL